MLSIMYVSTSAYPMGVQELDALLLRARAKNTSADITGLLLYKDEQFMQVMEGPDDAVRGLFENISADERHHDVRRLAEKQTVRRQFSQWSMGFRRLDEPQPDVIPGYDDFFAPTPDGEHKTTMRKREGGLMEWFRTH